jgi:DUF4097 and DUF4098 domain-containing protein YvlB
MRPIRPALLVLSLLALATSPAAAEEWNRTFPIRQHATLEVTTDDGRVDVHTWDRPEIAIKVVTIGWHINPQGVRITPVQEGDRVSLEVRLPHVRWDFGFRSRSIRVEINMPARAELAIRTGDGGVSVGPLEGTIHVHTGDGGITLDHPHGTVDLQSGDGHITATDVDGALNVITGDGGIDVDGRFDALDLESGDGRITATARGASKLGENWSVRSGDGSVTLRVPPALDATLDASTGDGRVSVDLPLLIEGSIDHHHVRGTLNHGGRTLRVRTGDGPVRILGS